MLHCIIVVGVYVFVLALFYGSFCFHSLYKILRGGKGGVGSINIVFLV